jgi:hypothetical protein
MRAIRHGTASIAADSNVGFRPRKANKQAEARPLATRCATSATHGRAVLAFNTVASAGGDSVADFGPTRWASATESPPTARIHAESLGNEATTQDISGPAIAKRGVRFPAARPPPQPADAVRTLKAVGGNRQNAYRTDALPSFVNRPCSRWARQNHGGIFWPVAEGRNLYFLVRTDAIDRRLHAARPTDSTPLTPRCVRTIFQPGTD